MANEMKTAGEILKKFIELYFEKRDWGILLNFLTDDVQWLGIELFQRAQNKSEVQYILEEEFKQNPNPFQIIYKERCETTVSHGDVASAEIIVQNQEQSLELRISAAIRLECHKICFIHISIPKADEGKGEDLFENWEEEGIYCKLQNLMDKISDGFGIYKILSRQIKPIMFNDSFCRMIGYTREELMIMYTKDPTANIHPQDKESLMQMLNKLKVGLEPEECIYRFRRADGRYIWVSVKVQSQLERKHNLFLYITYKDVTRYQEMKRQLWLQKERLHFLLEENNIILFEYDPGLKNMQIFLHDKNGNRKRQNIENYLNHLSGRNSIYPDYRETLRKNILEISKKEGERYIEYIGDYDGNGNRWYRAHFVSIVDEDENICYVLGKAQDIQEEKILQMRYEEELTRRKMTGGDLISSACFNISRNTLLEYQPEKHAKDLIQSGVNEEKIVSMIEQEIPGISDKKKFQQTFSMKRLLQQYQLGDCCQNIQYRRQVADGSVRWVSTVINLIRQPETGNILAFAYTYDINNEKTLRIMMDNVVATDYDFLMLLDAQKSTSKFYGNAQGKLKPALGETNNLEMAVDTFMRRYYAGDNINTLLEKMKLSHVIEELENKRQYTIYYSLKENGQIYQKKGKYFYVNKQQKLIGYSRMDITDISLKDQKKNQALSEALNTEKKENATKNKFLARMSRELRTPLNSIIGMSEIALQELGDREHIMDCLSKIGVSCRSLLGLMNDMLDINCIENNKSVLKKEKFILENFIRDIYAAFYTKSQEKKIYFDCEIDPGVDECYLGDCEKLKQVINHILENAFKFTQEDGKVTLNVRQGEKFDKEAVLYFTVSDTGCGIQEEFLPHLFEPFAQEDHREDESNHGIGLGLAVCHHLVSQMDGRISVHSMPQFGSEFTVEVKLGTLKGPVQKQLMDLKDFRVLIVDDDEAACKHTSIVLKELNIFSDWVLSGRTAIEKVRKEKRKGREYNLILIDWNMSEMDGLQTAICLHNIIDPGCILLLLTDQAEPELEIEAKKIGVNLVIQKPVFKSSLISALNQIISEKNLQEAIIAIQNYDFSGKRLLLVEDHPLNVEVAKRLLIGKGFCVEHAENGLKALEKFISRPEGYFDAILMDIRMPVMDGLQATRNIRLWNKPDAKTIPIIAMTANAFEEDREKGRTVGMNGYLAKPIEPKQMYQTLYHFLCKNANCKREKNIF